MQDFYGNECVQIHLFLFYPGGKNERKEEGNKRFKTPAEPSVLPDSCSLVPN